MFQSNAFSANRTTTLDLFMPKIVAVVVPDAPSDGCMRRLEGIPVHGSSSSSLGQSFVPSPWATAANAEIDTPFGALWTSLTRFLYQRLTSGDFPLLHLMDGFLYAPPRTSRPDAPGYSTAQCTLFGCSLEVTPTLVEAEGSPTVIALTITLLPKLRRYKWYQLPVAADVLNVLAAGKVAVLSSSVRDGSGVWGVQGPYCPTDDEHLHAIEIPSLAPVQILAVARAEPVIDERSSCLVAGKLTDTTAVQDAWFLLNRPHYDEECHHDGDADSSSMDVASVLRRSLVTSGKLWSHTVGYEGWPEIPPPHRQGVEDFLDDVVARILNIEAPFTGGNAAIAPSHSQPMYLFHPSARDIPDFALCIPPSLQHADNSGTAALSVGTKRDRDGKHSPSAPTSPKPSKKKAPPKKGKR